MPKYSVAEVFSRGQFIISRGPTYSMENRGTTLYDSAYDCSSFQGVINGIPGCPATPSMVSAYTAEGYIHLRFNGLGSLKKGDVLVYNKPGTSGEGANGHTAMYYGDNQFMQCWGHHGPGIRGAWGEYYWQDILRNPKGGIAIKSWNCTSHPSESF